LSTAVSPPNGPLSSPIDFSRREGTDPLGKRIVTPPKKPERGEGPLGKKYKSDNGATTCPKPAAVASAALTAHAAAQPAPQTTAAAAFAADVRPPPRRVFRKLQLQPKPPAVEKPAFAAAAAPAVAEQARIAAEGLRAMSPAFQPLESTGLPNAVKTAADGGFQALSAPPSPPLQPQMLPSSASTASATYHGAAYYHAAIARLAELERAEAATKKMQPSPLASSLPIAAAATASPSADLARAKAASTKLQLPSPPSSPPFEPLASAATAAAPAPQPPVIPPRVGAVAAAAAIVHAQLMTPPAGPAFSSPTPSAAPGSFSSPLSHLALPSPILQKSLHQTSFKASYSPSTPAFAPAKPLGMGFSSPAFGSLAGLSLASPATVAMPLPAYLLPEPIALMSPSRFATPPAPRRVAADYFSENARRSVRDKTVVWSEVPRKVAEMEGSAAAAASNAYKFCKPFRFTENFPTSMNISSSGLEIWVFDPAVARPNECARTITAHYGTLKRSGVAVPEILNLAEASDDGFFLVRVGANVPFNEWILTNPVDIALRNAELGRVRYGGQSFTIAGMRRQNGALGSTIDVAGSFSKVYLVNDNKKMFPERENNQILVKILKEEHVQKGPLYLKNMLDQFQQIRRDLPVATILNEATALKDGFIAIDFIPGTIQPHLLWGDRRAIDQIKQADLKHLEDVRKFFTYSITKKVLLDLKPDNFGIATAGDLRFFDFMEEIDEDELESTLIQALKRWCCGNENVRQFLLKDVKEMAGNTIVETLMTATL
jgi:hypothetical protein